MDCRLHFKDVFFVSAPWYLQDKNTWPFSEEMRAIGGGQRQGRVGGRRALCQLDPMDYLF